MRLSVILIGTSNSVLTNGFATAFASDPSIDFTNASLGASCSANAAWAVAMHDLRGRDFALIDLTNNDEHQAAHGFTSIDRVLNCYCTLINACAVEGVIPIIVEFPRQSYLDNHPVHDAVLGLGRQLGIATLNIHDLIKKLADQDPGNITISSLFLDEAHIKQNLAKAIGNRLTRIMHQIHSAGSKKVISVDRMYRRNYYVKAGNISGAEKLNRESSLLSLELSVILSGVDYSIDLGIDNADVVAIHLNSLESNASLFLAGKRVLGPSVESQGPKKWKLLSVIRPVRIPVSLSGVVSVEAQNEADSHEQVRFELAGLIMQERDPVTSLSVTVSQMAYFEISDTFDQDVLHELNSVIN